ncbi:MAG: polysaccharide deacetylase family protein [Endomicrobiia bacterium]
MYLHFAIKRIHIIFFLVSFIILTNAKNVFEEKIYILPKINNEIKKVAITFDDGPHPYYTEKIVEIITKHNVKTTFFLVGKQVEKYPEIVKLISKNKNCKIGNHTYSHKNLTKLSLKEVYDEINKTQNLLYSIVDEKDKIISYFRPPGGNYDRKVLEILEKMKLNIALWSVFTNDHCEDIKKEDLIDTINTFCNNQQEIILLHSGVQTTLEALEEIIQILKNKGYSFVFIDEILDEKNFSN